MSRYPREQQRIPERQWQSKGANMVPGKGESASYEERIEKYLDVVKKACLGRGVAGIKLLGR